LGRTAAVRIPATLEGVALTVASAAVAAAAKNENSDALPAMLKPVYRWRRMG
jgi:hypothetical protein